MSTDGARYAALIEADVARAKELVVVAAEAWYDASRTPDTDRARLGALRGELSQAVERLKGARA